MKADSSPFRSPLSALFVLSLGTLCLFGDTTVPAPDGKLVDFNSSFNPASVQTAHATVGLAAGGKNALDVKFSLGEPFPNLVFTGPGEGWNLSGYAGVQIDVTNNGEAAATVALRADNPGDWQTSPWNIESALIAPGETQTIKVMFGKSYGFQPGFALDPAHVISVQIFLDHPSAESSLSIANLKAFK